MAEKVFLKQFEESKGLDYRRSPLSGPDTVLQRALNTRFGETRSFRKRPGFHGIGQPGRFIGIHDYSYPNKDTGATDNELLAVNEFLWRLKSYSVAFTRISGSGEYTCSIALQGGAFVFSITGNGISYTKNVGTGFESPPFGVWDLVKDINASLSGTLSVTSPEKSAKVSSISVGATVHVESGHTLAARDFISVIDGYNGGEQLRSFYLSSTTATTLTLKSGTPQIASERCIGPGAVPAAFIGEGDWTATSSSGSLTMSWYAWEAVPCRTLINNPSYVPTFSFLTSSNNVLIPDATLSAVNAQGCVYFAFKYTAASGANKRRVYKYDGRHVLLAGLQRISLDSVDDSGGAFGTVAGRYRYMASLEIQDARGNIVESPAGAGPNTAPTPYAEITTVGGTQLRVKCTAPSDLLYSNARCGIGQAAVSGAQTSPATQTGITVVLNHSIVPGDTVYLTDSSGNVISRTVTAVGSTSITWASTTGFSVSDGAQVHSTPIYLKLWKTVSSGVSFYLCYKKLFNFSTPSQQTILDDTIDSTLTGIEFIEPMFERDPPGAASILSFHQGLLVASGDPDNPNMVTYSSPENVEYFPAATNSFEIPATISGPITAIASDSDDRLAVFKANSYYDVPGDLASAAYSIVTVREGDYGVSSHASLRRVDGVLVGVCSLGIVFVKGGSLTWSPAEAFAPRFWHNTDIDFSRAVAFNDRENRTFRLFVPDKTLSTAGANPTKSIAPVLDYANDGIWFEDSFTPGMEPSGGGVITTLGGVDRVLHLSVKAGGISGYNGGQVFIQDINKRYRDNHLAIDRDIIFQAWDLDEPSVDKDWVRLKLYSMYSVGEEEWIAPFTETFETYRNFVAVSPANIHSNGTLSFPDENTFEGVCKLNSGKARALTLRLRNNTIGESGHITGIELVAALPYRKEDIGR